MKPTVYIKCSKSKCLDGPEVTVGDLASVYCEDVHIASKVKSLRVATRPKDKSGRYVVSVLKIIELICNAVPGVAVESEGEFDTVVEFSDRKGKSSSFETVKVVVVCLITLIGGAFAIMAYNNDIGADNLILHIYELLQAEELRELKIFEYSYTVGLAVGIICFYGHFGNWKKGNDPTPLEVEMRLYEDDINTAVIKQSEREEVEIDV